MHLPLVKTFIHHRTRPERLAALPCSPCPSAVPSALYLADARHGSDRVMRVLSGVLQRCDKRKLLLQEELVVLFYGSQSLLYLVHVSPSWILVEKERKEATF